MQFFVKLTFAIDGAPVYVNLSQVATVARAYADAPGTLLRLAGKDSVIVKESPEEIYKMSLEVD